ncbi:UNVERIFIED_CONTAM: hypothetical protein PYX00_011889 [Menopon gallinae]|uniref:Cell division cycle protein 27 homolog n=1 Tax=Menopon gallinae TaxID=328185 RepID=A0AAW2H8Y9_9NEOP
MARVEDEMMALYRHRCYEDLRFLLSILVLQNKKYNLVMQVVEYETGNYARSLQFASHTYTSRYYEALAYREMREYGKAAAVLHSILDEESPAQELFHSLLDVFVMERRLDIVFELLGDVYQNLGEKEQSLKFYRKSFSLNKNSYRSFMQLFIEKGEGPRHKSSAERATIIGERIKTQRAKVGKLKNGAFDAVVDSELECPFVGSDFKENEHFRIFERARDRYGPDEVFKRRLLKDVCRDGAAEARAAEHGPEACTDSGDRAVDDVVASFYGDMKTPEAHVEKYKHMCPGVGSYFLAELAVIFSEEERIGESLCLFEFVRKREKGFVHNIDVYSTILYRKGDKDRLALLSRELLKYNHGSSITWSVLGNYYSLMGDSTRSILCLRKSLDISMSYYTAALMGHECYHKKDLELAQSYFNLSLLLCSRNYNALVGLGLTYFSLNQPGNAVFFLHRAIQVSPRNLMIRYILIKYALRAENYSEVLATMENVFKFRSTDDSMEKRITGLYNYLSKPKRRFSEIEEMMLMEFAIMLVEQKQPERAERLLSVVESRPLVYYKIKNLILSSTEVLRRLLEFKTSGELLPGKDLLALLLDGQCDYDEDAVERILFEGKETNTGRRKRIGIVRKVVDELFAWTHHKLGRVRDNTGGDEEKGLCLLEVKSCEGLDDSVLSTIVKRRKDIVREEMRKHRTPQDDVGTVSCTAQHGRDNGVPCSNACNEPNEGAGSSTTLLSDTGEVNVQSGECKPHQRRAGCRQDTPKKSPGAKAQDTTLLKFQLQCQKKERPELTACKFLPVFPPGTFKPQITVRKREDIVNPRKVTYIKFFERVKPSTYAVVKDKLFIRNSLRRLPNVLDYEYDSDLEWEDCDDAEDVGSTDESEETDGEDDIDFVDTDSETSVDRRFTPLEISFPQLDVVIFYDCKPCLNTPLLKYESVPDSLLCELEAGARECMDIKAFSAAFASEHNIKLRAVKKKIQEMLPNAVS